MKLGQIAFKLGHVILKLTKRFISADTIVPDPGNPQQYNRYSYVLNNSLRYSDPTGHMCYDHTAGPELIGTCFNEDGSTYSLLPLIRFDGDGWTAAEMGVVNEGAWQVALMLYRAGGGQFSSPYQAFMAVYDGAVTFRKTGETHWNLGYAKSKNLILVHNQNQGATVTSLGGTWVAHELGHAFDKALYPNGIDNLQYGRGTIDLATSNIKYTNSRGIDQPIAGGCNNSNYLTTCYTRESDGYVKQHNIQLHHQWKILPTCFLAMPIALPKMLLVAPGVTG